MPTYDYTGDGDGSIHSEFFRKHCVLKREMKVADIIASNTTLTTNGVIAAADIIEMIDVPAAFVIENFVVKTVTAEGAALTADFGIDGGDELYDGFDLNQAAGTYTLITAAQDWGVDNVNGYVVAAANTLDMTFVAETDAGEWHVWFAGFFLD